MRVKLVNCKLLPASDILPREFRPTSRHQPPAPPQHPQPLPFPKGGGAEGRAAVPASRPNVATSPTEAHTGQTAPPGLEEATRGLCESRSAPKHRALF